MNVHSWVKNVYSRKKDAVKKFNKDAGTDV